MHQHQRGGPAQQLLLAFLVAAALVSLRSQRDALSPLILYPVDWTGGGGGLATTRRRSTSSGSVGTSETEQLRRSLAPLLSPLPRDEFVHKGATQQEIESFFRFDFNSSDASIGRGVEPMWNCSTDDGPPDNNPRRNSKKLIFLHTWRSAGATVRALLRGYAYFCNAGIVTVSHCLDLGREYMEGGDPWTNSAKASGNVDRAGETCVLSSAANRTGHQFTNRSSVSTALLEEHDVDILAGHVPLGCHEFWRNPQDEGNGRRQRQQPVDVQYFVFLRDPLDKFVSSLLFARDRTNPNFTVDQGVNLVAEAVRNLTDEGLYHEKYSNLLITPEQKAWVQQERVVWTHERRVNLTLSNLVRENVLVGIVERFSESLAMIQSVIDGRNEATRLFEFFAAATTSDGNDGDGKSANRVLSEYIRSKNRTDTIVRRIKEDANLLQAVEEWLKYERQIYVWGKTIHQRQFEKLVLSELRGGGEWLITDSWGTT